MHACGGRHAGRHKKSFQRLPGTDGAPPARPSALSASELRTALAASPPAAAAAKRPPPALPEAAAPPAKASRAAPPRAAAPAPTLDPWSRVFRRAAGVDAVDDVSDAEEPPAEEPDDPPAAAEQPWQPPVVPPPPVAPPAAALAKHTPHADAAPPRTRAGKAAPPPRPASPVRLSAPLTEAELETALQVERETQRRVLVSRHVRIACGAALTSRRIPSPTQASMGIVFNEAPAVELPAPTPASSSDYDVDSDHAADAGAAPGNVVREATAASPDESSFSDVSEDDEAPARRGRTALVSQDEGAWTRALRQAAGEDGEQVPFDPPAVSRPAAARKATDAHEDAEQSAPKKTRPLPTPAERKGVAAALERTRLGEGPRGVYFADNAFDWRELAVNPAQQTWSLLGGGAVDDDTAPEAQAHAELAHPVPDALGTAAPRPTVAAAPLAALNLHTLGASFMRSEGADSAWEVNREALAVDFKNKRRQALRQGRTSAPKR